MSLRGVRAARYGVTVVVVMTPKREGSGTDRS
jgi:hypothetical protein